MFGNTWWSTKVGENLLSDLVIFLRFLSDTPFDLHELIQVVPLKIFINT